MRAVLVSSVAIALAAGPLLAQGVPCFEPNFGTNLTLGDDQVSSGQALGFAFPFAGGTVSAVYVSSNGFVWLAPSTNSACCNGSVNDFLSGLPRIAPLWTDLDPSSSGGVYFTAMPGRAIVTWDQVPEYGVPTPFTVQLQMASDGTIVLFWDGNVTIAGHTTLIGVTPGRGVANPGALDFSAALPFNSGGTATVYESFGQGSFDLAGSVVQLAPNTQGGYTVTRRSDCMFAGFQPFGSGCPSAPRPVSLFAVQGSRPVIGGTFSMIVGDAPAGSLAGFLVNGLSDIPGGTSLAGLGMPGCVQWVAADDVRSFGFQGTYTQVDLPIPNNMALVGFAFFTQAALIAPGVNALGAAVSNGARIGIGT